MEEAQLPTLDVMVKGEKKGVAYNVNPVNLTTDSECKDLINKLKSELSLTPEQSALLDSCVSVLDATDNDVVHFGPGEILELSVLAQQNLTHSAEILACSQYISECVDCEGELPPNIFLNAAKAYGALTDVMTAALASGVINEHTEFSDEETSEEDITEEEELSDDME